MSISRNQSQNFSRSRSASYSHDYSYVLRRKDLEGSSIAAIQLLEIEGFCCTGNNSEDFGLTQLNNDHARGIKLNQKTYAKDEKVTIEWLKNNFPNGQYKSLLQHFSQMPSIFRAISAELSSALSNSTTDSLLSSFPLNRKDINDIYLSDISYDDKSGAVFWKTKI